jgi:hypothetical protein
VLRVIQWATGNVGRHAAAAIHRHPDLELVGALVYSDAKAGRDVGDICGLGPIGVTATTDRDAIVALDADCVVYTPQGEMDPMGALDDICRLLASGKNVVSTAVTAFIHPASAGAAVVERLDAACAEGGTSFHGTGIEPGWAGEVLPLTMSGILHRVDSILVQELMDYSTYGSTELMFDIMGFGLSPDAPVPLADADLAGTTFRAPLMLLADGGRGDAVDGARRAHRRERRGRHRPGVPRHSHARRPRHRPRVRRRSRHPHVPRPPHDHRPGDPRMSERPSAARPRRARPGYRSERGPVARCGEA